MKTNFKYTLGNILTEKCPNCGQSQVFKKSNHLLQIPDMKADCEVCHHHFEKEPGYFYGAMYVSYGLTVAEGIAVFLFMKILFPGLHELYVIAAIVLVIITLAIKNFKLSRMIWMNLFHSSKIS